MNANQNEESLKPIEFNFNSKLFTTWVDEISVGARNDDLMLLRFFSNLPEGAFEQTRLMTSKEHLKNFIGVLCAAAQYYPTKPSKAKQKPKNKQ